MLEHPNFDPVAFSLGHYDLPLLGQISLDVRWYGLMYLVGFCVAWFLGAWRLRSANALMTKQQFGDLLFWGALGVIIGGRMGYVLFYAWSYFVEDPMTLLRFWEGGMSFHGGFFGVLVALVWASWRFKLHFFQLGDFVAPLIPIGLGAGRMGNFINGELYGRVSEMPWAMSFNQTGVYRHPSQLYQFFLEGVVLFALLWWFSSKPRQRMSVSALFLIGYGLFRFLVEFFREPDAHIGYLGAGLTMGQWLSLPMVAAGVVIFAWLAWKRGIKFAS